MMWNNLFKVTEITSVTILEAQGIKVLLKMFTELLLRITSGSLSRKFTPG